MDEEVYVFEGKTTNEAIEKGLKELKTSKSNVEIKVLEEEKKTFFSILDTKTFKVEMKIKDKNFVKEEKNIEDVVTEMQQFMEKFVSKLPGKDIKCQVGNDGNSITVDISGHDATFLIGYRGETLNALQVLLTNVASKERSARAKVQLNICNYRQKREDDLKKLANRIAEAVVAKKKAITLEPMSSFDRKVIHTELQNHEKVQTYSVGEEPHRKVVISLKQ